MDAAAIDEVQLPLDMIETLEKFGASNELFERWQELEARTTISSDGSTPVPPGVRERAVWHIECMARQAGCLWNSFFRCVALFDAFCSLRGNRSGIEATPSVCAAVVGVFKKADCATVLVKYENLAEQASQLSQ